ncbi:hypothetical protein D7X98_12000 [bacterium 1XD8-76]|mgnify:CR=1 FL=1|nr:hypothetical protein D7X98_12000 [bacterium 1XD8-76]
MSVGKGSIQRAAKVKDAAEKKEAPAKKAAKAPAKKKDTVVAASVVSSDDIHEKKFEAVSHIYCELPTYLL